MKMGEKVFNKKTHEIVMIVGFSEDKKYVALGKTMGDMLMQTGVALVDDLQEIEDAVFVLPKKEAPATVDKQVPTPQSV